MLKKSSILFLVFIILTIFLTSSFTTAQLIPPKAKGTPSGGPTIDQAQREDAMGPKARVTVTRFDDKSAKGKFTGQIGEGMAEMLANALFGSNRFIVLERQTLGDVLQEQDLGASGRVKTETAARIGEIEGADLLIRGTITEFEPGTSGAGGAMGGISPGRSVAGGIFGGISTSHVAMVVKVIDAKTSRVLASEQVEGKATDIGGGIGGVGGGLAGVFAGYSKTPMEKAIRVAIEEAVRVITAKTPAEYFRGSVTRQPQPASVTPPVVSNQAPRTPPSQLQPLSPSPSPAPRILYVKWPTVSLREAPGLDSKTMIEIKKGTVLSILEDKGQWLRVRLEDGQEGWIGRATTSETP